MHGCAKTDAELDAALAGRAGRLVVDNREELERLAARAHPGRPLPILLRLNTGIEAHTHAFVRTGGEDSKFGIPLAEVDAALAAVSDLLDKQWIGRQLEGLDEMRLEPEGTPDPADGRLAHARGLGHRTGRPMRGIGRSLLEGLDDYSLHGLVVDPARRPGPGLVVQPVQSVLMNRSALGDRLSVDPECAHRPLCCCCFRHTPTQPNNAVAERLRACRTSRPTFEGCPASLGQDHLVCGRAPVWPWLSPIVADDGGNTAPGSQKFLIDRELLDSGH